MIFDEIKFVFQRVFSSKYKIAGKCNQCGKCCKEIIFVDGPRKVATQEHFEAMKKFDKRYNNFEIAGYDEDKKALLFKCKALSENGKCGSYKFRSLACRLYPNPTKKFLLGGGKLLDGCGYRIEKTKKFKDFCVQ